MPAPRSLAVLSLLGALTALPGCAIPGVSRVPAATRLASAKVEVPLVRREGGYWGRLAIDGQGPFEMEFDSGAGIVVIADAVAEQLDLGTWALPGRLQGASESRWTLLRRGSVQNISAAGVGRERGNGPEIPTQRAADFDEVGFLALDLPPGKHGIFGIGLFAGCLATFDGPRQRLVLEAGELPEPDGKTIFPYTLVGDVPNIVLDVAGRRLEVTIDSGFSAWLRVPPEVADALPLRAGEGRRVEVSTVHGQAVERMHRLVGSVRLGVHEIRDPELLVGQGDPLLGVRVLEHFALTFDQVNQRVRFERDAFAPIFDW